MNESITIWDVAAFVVEIALLVIAVVAVRALVGGGLGGWFAAGAALLTIGVVWGLLVAPTAPYVLSPGPRAGLAAAIFLAVSGAALWAGLVTTGVLLALIGVPVMVIAQLARGPIVEP